MVVSTLVASSAASAAGSERVLITEAAYEGREQFKIVAAGATWFYDKAGGGFSRLIDREGRDWIGFHESPSRKSPAGAAADFRGIPNLVHGNDNPDAGVGHPGFNRCESVIVGSDAIRTISKSRVWQWTWRFTAAHAELTIERADADQPWWFLYEGPPAGRFLPREQYWGTDLGGPRRETPNHASRESIQGNWRWAYFGDTGVARVLFVAQLGRDAITDTFSYMGNTPAGINSPDGMVVFGFGRVGALPLMKGAGGKFVVGFIEQAVPEAAAHARVARDINAQLPP
jgi:hypothetical protein